MRREIKCGNVLIGGTAPISVQSMTNTNTADVEATINQIKALQLAGCDIVRVAVPNMEAAAAIKEIKANIEIPLVVDIHFDYKLALESIKNGADKVRINPGNIGAEHKVKEVVNACKSYGVPIRIGVNGGSLDPKILKKHGKMCAEALYESMIEHVEILERNGFSDMVLSVKSTDMHLNVATNQMLFKHTNYPIHIGVTESGNQLEGIVKSSVGIGHLLMQGIGNTLRVSLTDHPVEEVKVGKQILRVAGLLNDRIEIISCPTCGRTKIDLITLVNQVKERIGSIKTPIKVAVMGCAVNGPGEAKEADIGIAGGDGCAILFKKGIILRKVAEADIVDELEKEVKKIIEEV